MGADEAAKRRAADDVRGAADNLSRALKAARELGVSVRLEVEGSSTSFVERVLRVKVGSATTEL